MDPNSEVEKRLLDILEDKLQTKLRYLKMRKIKTNHFEIGDKLKTRSEFLLLQTANEESQENQHLCIKYGSGLLLFDDHIENINLK